MFTVLKGPRRGMPLSADGLDEILDGARRAGRPGPGHLSPAAAYLPDPAAQSRDEPGGGTGPGRARLDRGQARIYLHLGDDWLASQYRRAAEAIDAQALAAHPAVASAR